MAAQALGRSLVIGIGVIGAGFMGGTHARAYQAVPGAKVLGIAAGRMPEARHLAEQVGAQPFASSSDLLRDDRIKAVSIAVPTDLHRDLVLEALEAGKHVLVEKPFSLTSQACDEMIAAAARANRLLMVGHVLRFWPEYTDVVEVVRSGVLGVPLAASALRLSSRPEWSPWLNDAARSGGAVHDFHIHDLDVLNWLFGSPEMVSTHGCRGPYGGWDRVVTTLEYGGVNATAEADILLPTGYPFTMALRVVCTRGTVEFIHRGSGDQIDAGPDPDSSVTVYPEQGDSYRLPRLEGRTAYTLQAEAFVEAAQAGRPPQQAGLEEAHLAVRTALAARESVEEGRPVRLASTR